MPINYHQKDNYLPAEFLFGDEIEIDQIELNKMLKKNKFDPGYESQPAAKVYSDAGSNAPGYQSRTAFSSQRPKTQGKPGGRLNRKVSQQS